MNRQEIIDAAKKILSPSGVEEVEKFLQYEEGEAEAIEYILSKIDWAWDEDEDFSEERMIECYAFMGITVNPSSTKL